MPKRTSHVVSLTLALVLFITPMVVLADHDPTILHGTVFRDEDGNGNKDVGDVGMEGVTVSLFSSVGPTLMSSIQTGPDGTYDFTILESGDYIVEVEVIVGYDDSTDNPVPFSVDGSPLLAVDFGKEPLPIGSISGTVYNDINRSRLFDGGDEVLPGVEVRLIDDSDTISPTTTDGLGKYEFTDLLPGSYTVIETDPEGFYSTTPNTVMVNLPHEDSMEVVVDFGDFQPEEGEVKRIDLLIMKFFDLPLLDLIELRGESGWGYGNIAKAYFLAQLSDVSVTEIITMRDGMGWGNIMKAVLGRPGLKGYNLGLIVSGREMPNSTQKLIESCVNINTPEEVQELYGMGASNGAIKKACRLASEVDESFATLVRALDLIKTYGQKEAREMLMSGNTNQVTNGNSGNHGPPPCKGKNKNDEGCN